MPNASAGEPHPPLPAELLPDFERFRDALRASPRASGAWSALADPSAEARSALTDSAAEARWREYGRLLYEGSSELSLIAKGDRREVFTRHILDSLNPLSLFESAPASALDIGSGGGLPGIPLAIAWPDTRVVLLEARERKAGFLERAARLLGLRNVRVVCDRLEGYGSTWSCDPFESVFVRALGGLDLVLRLASAAAQEDGRWVYFLGAQRTVEAVLPGDRGIKARVVEGPFGGRLLTGDLRDFR